MNAVDALTKEKMIIMIAHRLKTVRHVEQIVVVDKERIAQLGKQISKLNYLKEA